MSKKNMVKQPVQTNVHRGEGVQMPSVCSPEPVNYSGKLMAKNTVYNLSGRILPMLVAVVAVPFIIEGLGVQRFGVLTLVWLVVGYFGLFDIGIGRATTKFVAEALANGEHDKLSELVWGSLSMLILLGIVAGGLAAALTPWLVGDVLNIPAELKDESRQAFFLLAISFPFILGTSGLRGVFEGQHRFGLVNVIKVPASAFTFLAVLGVLLFSNNIAHIVAALVCGRFIVFLVHAYFCISSMPGKIRIRLVRGEVVRRLLSFGGWLAITNLLGSLIAFGFIDRFIISSMLDMSAMAYYATPFETAIKLLLLSSGVVGVLFPVFSAYASDQGEKLLRLHRQAIRILLLCMSPVALVFIAFSEPALNLWLGAEFARESTIVLQLIIAGVLICSISLVPSSAIQAVGRPDLTAKRHLYQLPVYVGLAWFCIHQWGIVGAAATWLTWQIADNITLFWLLRKALPAVRDRSFSSGKLTAAVAGGAILCSGALASIPDLAVRAAATFTGLALFTVSFWSFGLNRQDRDMIKSLLRISINPLKQSSIRRQQ